MRCLGGLIGVLLAVLVAAPAGANVAPCQKAMLGKGSADWRSQSVVAGPVGVRRPALKQMSPAGRYGMVTKMPILAEGRAPEAVTVSVPERLRKRVFLYYGRIVGRDGEPTTSFYAANGYSSTRFELCPNKPRTIWPGGIRVKGRGPVQLLVHVAGRDEPYRLRLGRPRPYRPPA